ncbi:hypothetical protein EVAR_79476_1 [Eumeta japonica]|uniref:Uncharacterized protein n=1 Tax=Eumeta variegata TaxID=151549 RepID=A0A4C1UEN2_EUMVA|nr:hypothetical protein EVAR_79476_1 [Eumeta japonica]
MSRGTKTVLSQLPRERIGPVHPAGGLSRNGVDLGPSGNILERARARAPRGPGNNSREKPLNIPSTERPNFDRTSPQFKFGGMSTSYSEKSTFRLSRPSLGYVPNDTARQS